MNALLDAISRDPWKAAARPLSLAIVYEDSHTHRQANAAYQSLLRALGEDAVLMASWWRTSIVADPKLARSAALSIAASDLILIAARDDSSPGPGIRTWMENWPVDGTQPKLLALLGNGPVELSEWHTMLQGVASRRQMIYVAGLGRLDGSECLTAGAEPTLPHRFIEPYQHWGLNE